MGDRALAKRSAAGAADGRRGGGAAGGGIAAGGGGAAVAGTLRRGARVIRAFVNGEYRELSEGATVESMVREIAESSHGVAVAVDGEVVPRGEWAERSLRDGEEVEVLHAVQGGSPEAFEIAGRPFESRLVLGTGGFRNLETMAAAAVESGAELATVAMRRVDPRARGSILEVLEDAGLDVLPNTAGCFTAREAVT